jgi:hypothetical protein
MIEVPNWAVALVAGAGGVRLAKREKYRYIPKHVPIWQKHDGLFRRNDVKRETLEGNLDYNDFRYFSGSLNPGTNYARCRCCSETLFTHDTKELTKHLKEKGCAKRLVKAYTLLRKEKLCVVCDTITSKEIWGIPLHLVCRETWMALAVQPYALAAALRETTVN